MKIGKVLKKIGFLIGIISLLVGSTVFIRQIGIMIKYGGDLTFVAQTVFFTTKVMMTSLFIYGFGEIIELLSKINENLQNKIVGKNQYV